MAEAASISHSIAERYATAAFELAREAGTLSGLESDIASLNEALAASPELVRAITSPVISRAEHGRAMAALAGRLGLGGLMANTLALMAERRRLFVLPQLLRDLAARIADARGEVTAEVIAPAALTQAQAKALSEALGARAGKTVRLNTTVDEGLIGGLVVKLGSTMIDTSIRSKLASLQNAMKEVG
mgnify:CR=1 FL=1